MIHAVFPVAEAFLVMAMALPPGNFRPAYTNADAVVFREFAEFNNHPNVSKSPNNRILLIGGRPDFLMALTMAHLKVWRLIHDGVLPGDIVGTFYKMPIRTGSMKIVVWNLETWSDPWIGMQCLTAALEPLDLFGFFLYTPAKNPHFKRFLEKKGYARLPFTWRDYLIYQRIRGSHYAGNGQDRKVHYIPLGALRPNESFNGGFAPRDQSGVAERALDATT